MKYNFKDLLNEDIYNNTRVMLVTGKYQLFNNLVSDTLKDMSMNKDLINGVDLGISDEFGIEESEDTQASTSIDIDGFFDSVTGANLYGKWFCSVDLGSLSAKQESRVQDYIKNPSKNGILVLTSTDYRKFNYYLKNKSFLNGQYCHIFQLGFPNREVMKAVVAGLFEDFGMNITSTAIEYFIMKMSDEYDKYIETIDYIKTNFDIKTLDIGDIKTCMKGIEYFSVEDFVYEMLKPMSSGKTGKKKIIRMLAAVKEKYESEELVNQLLKVIKESIEFRTLINKGYISINIRYMFKDVINLIGKDSEYAKMNEFVFRRKADLASRTSMQDWIYMYLILSKAQSTGFHGSAERKVACERALYDLVTRSTLCKDRLNNIIGFDNVLTHGIRDVDRIVYDENELKELRKEEEQWQE